ncbi:MAG: creatininase family protein [Bryobacteraceae bacterium]
MKLFAEMTRQQLREAAADALVVLPIGATEQHGPHLPTGTDYFTVEALSREAAAAAADRIPVIVTPALPFGSSDHHLPFGGTLSFSTETYYRVLRELVDSLATDGFTRIFLVNGHGGNHELAQLAARDVALKRPVRVAAGSYWTIAWEALVGEGAHSDTRLPGHAGDFETSMMMSLRGDIVTAKLPHRDGSFPSDPRNFHAAYRAEKHGSWQDIDGFTDSPDRATAEKGARYRKAVVGALAEAFVAFYRG